MIEGEVYEQYWFQIVQAADSQNGPGIPTDQRPIWRLMDGDNLASVSDIELLVSNGWFGTPPSILVTPNINIPPTQSISYFPEGYPGYSIRYPIDTTIFPSQSQVVDY